jgi:hypothetical protein
MSHFDAFTAQIVAFVRTMPDEALLDLVRGRLGVAAQPAAAAAPAPAPAAAPAAAPQPTAVRTGPPVARPVATPPSAMPPRPAPAARKPAPKPPARKPPPKPVAARPAPIKPVAAPAVAAVAPAAAPAAPAAESASSPAGDSAGPTPAGAPAAAASSIAARRPPPRSIASTAADRKQLSPDEKASLFEKVEKVVKSSEGLAASEIARAVGVEQNRVATVLKELKHEGRIFQGGDRRFARYAASQDAADLASITARNTASGPALKR